MLAHSAATNRHSSESEQAAADDMIAEEMARAMQHYALVDTLIHDDDNLTTLRASGLLVQSSKMAHLPVELLLFIFTLTQDGLYLHDPSIIQGPRSPWMVALRTRKSLALTCKAFTGPATELLYGDIVLRRMAQIPALARTLNPAYTASAGVFSQLVRSIRIDSCVVWAPFAEVVREDLRSILKRCTALTAFSYRPHPNYDLRPTLLEGPEDAFRPEWLWDLDTGGKLTGALQPQTLRSLRFLDLQLPRCDASSWLALNAALDSASNLVKLRLYPLHIIPEPASPPDLTRAVRLPALEDLQVYDRNVAPPFDSYVQIYISQSWELPRLTALTVSGSDMPPRDAPLIRTYGAQITYLQWGTNAVSRRQLFQDTHNLGTWCPRLEHLVVQGYFIREALPSIVSPTLRFLDLWSSRYDPDRPDVCVIQECVAQLVKTGTPRLERINVSVNPHRRSAKFHWPRLSSSFALSIDGNDLYKDPGLPDIHIVWTELSEFPMEYLPTWSDLGPFNPIYSYVLSPETLDDDPSEDGTDLESSSSGGDCMGDLEDDVDEDDTDSMSEVSDGRTQAGDLSPDGDLSPKWGDQGDEASSDGVLNPIGGTLTQEHQVDRETMLAMFQDSQEGGVLLSDFDEEE